MSGTTWTKFFWSDWESDPALRLCSFAAQGLWMRLLCIAAAHDPIGYVAVAGRPLGATDIARMTGGSEGEVADLLGELDRNGVFSRDRQTRIYSRRMVNDAKRAAIARKNGAKGGNPNLSKERGNETQDNHPDNTRLKTQEPEARDQILSVPDGTVSPQTARLPAKPTAQEVETIWAFQPSPHGKRRSTRPDVARALEAARRRGGLQAEIEAGCRAYYGLEDSQREDGQYAMGAKRLLEVDRWREFLSSAGGDAGRAARWGHDEWRAAVSIFAESGRWSVAAGPPPDTPGCRAPPDILAEYKPPLAVGARPVPFPSRTAA